MIVLLPQILRRLLKILLVARKLGFKICVYIGEKALLLVCVLGGLRSGYWPLARQVDSHAIQAYAEITRV